MMCAHHMEFFDGSDWTIDETKNDSKGSEKEIYVESKAVAVLRSYLMIMTYSTITPNPSYSLLNSR